MDTDQYDLYGDFMQDVTVRCLKCFDSQCVWTTTSPSLTEILQWVEQHARKECKPYVQKN